MKPNSPDFVEIMRSIQSKYVGTADEHKLLEGIIDDYEKTVEWFATDHENQLRELRDSLSGSIRRADALTKGQELDSVVYGWLKDGRNMDWHLRYVAEAMLGRGLTSEDMPVIEDAMRKIKESIANHESTSAN